MTFPHTVLTWQYWTDDFYSKNTYLAVLAWCRLPVLYLRGSTGPITSTVVVTLSDAPKRSDTTTLTRTLKLSPGSPVGSWNKLGAADVDSPTNTSTTTKLHHNINLNFLTKGQIFLKFAHFTYQYPSWRRRLCTWAAGHHPGSPDSWGWSVCSSSSPESAWRHTFPYWDSRLLRKWTYGLGLQWRPGVLLRNQAMTAPHHDEYQAQVA